jgi:hypothetical protein
MDLESAAKRMRLDDGRTAATQSTVSGVDGTGPGAATTHPRRADRAAAPAAAPGLLSAATLTGTPATPHPRVPTRNPVATMDIDHEQETKDAAGKKASIANAKKSTRFSIRGLSTYGGRRSARRRRPGIPLSQRRQPRRRPHPRWREPPAPTAARRRVEASRAVTPTLRAGDGEPHDASNRSTQAAHAHRLRAAHIDWQRAYAGRNAWRQCVLRTHAP